MPAQPDDFSSLNKFKQLLERTDLSMVLYRVLTERFKIGFILVMHLNEHLCLYVLVPMSVSVLKTLTWCLFIMVALCNRETIYIFILFLLLYGRPM